ncbi:MAG: sulfite exporter TauE/SafE family protein [Akkermansiaceae bacterium]|nr:sulfite exporter TauE/SafE family protein [Akkermansiaceae bacterium]
MFRSKVFTAWFFIALTTWIILFTQFNSLEFLASHFHYPLIMVLGAFVAGLTPEGGGAVAFPVLSVFFSVDRVLARDFSLMIQSIGMTSASIFILSHPDNRLRTYKPLLWFIPVTFVGFVLGMQLLQQIPVYIIQALFLSLITSFAIAYLYSKHRGDRPNLQATTLSERVALIGILILGGMCASLFGTGADIILYTMLVTRFAMNEKVATHMSIILMASISVLGFAYRHFVDAGLAPDQFRTWLCAFPVVLFMAPFGTYILQRMNVEWMLRGIVVLNIGQLAYFNLNQPTVGKFVASAIFFTLLTAIFCFTLARIVKNKRQREADPSEAAAGKA